MNPSEIVLYVGVAVIALGAIMWAVSKNQGTAENTIKTPGGFEFTLNTPALAVMAMGIVVVLVSQKLPEGKSEEIASSGLDPALLGSWDASAQFQQIDLKLHFDFRNPGFFARKYTHDEQGLIEPVAEGVRFTGSQLVRSKITFVNDGTNSLVASTDGQTFRYSRIGDMPHQDNPLLGKWQTEVLVLGANWRFILDFESLNSYRFHAEAEDEGPFSATNGEWKMTSNWNTQPIEGAYKILSPNTISFDLYPFNWTELHRSR